MSTRAASHPILSPALIRRHRPMLLPPPAVQAPRAVAIEPARGWSDDLRFFVTCYAAGVVFFFIMLS